MTCHVGGPPLPRLRESPSAELALAMGLRHPDVYGAVLCASPGGGYRPPAVMPSSVPRAYLVAGMEESFFRQNAARWADALRDAGAGVHWAGASALRTQRGQARSGEVVHAERALPVLREEFRRLAPPTAARQLRRA